MIMKTQKEREITGVHHMGDRMNDVDRSRAERNEKQWHESANLILGKVSNKSLSAANKLIVPTGFTIIIKPYSDNPYTGETLLSDSGLIIAPSIGLDGVIMSEDSGEIESLPQGIGCAKVIAVGPECKYCEEGDDVYYRDIAIPVPFNKLGYYSLSEQNVMCRIINK